MGNELKKRRWFNFSYFELHPKQVEHTLDLWSETYVLLDPEKTRIKRYATAKGESWYFWVKAVDGTDKFTHLLKKLEIDLRGNVEGITATTGKFSPFVWAVAFKKKLIKFKPRVWQPVSKWENVGFIASRVVKKDFTQDYMFQFRDRFGNSIRVSFESLQKAYDLMQKPETWELRKDGSSSGLKTCSSCGCSFREKVFRNHICRGKN